MCCTRHRRRIGRTPSFKAHENFWLVELTFPYPKLLDLLVYLRRSGSFSLKEQTHGYNDRRLAQPRRRNASVLTGSAQLSLNHSCV